MRRRAAPLFCLPVLFAAALGGAATPAAGETLRVMSFNIWGGGANEGRGMAETVAAIRAANPDIIGIQETRREADPCDAVACPAAGASVAAEIARALGYFYHDQTGTNDALWANAVISRFPIGAPSAHDLGVPVTVAGRVVWIFNIHLDDEPYQPYQLLNIPYGPAPFIATEAESVRYATDTRRAGLDLLMADMAQAADVAAVLVTGDFNEPSELDWTAATAAAGTHPVAVRWPATRRLAEAGFIDAFRAVHPDPVAKPAFTWTARGDEDDPQDHHDRIDFVFARGAGVAVQQAAIVGEAGPRSNIAVSPWPSDHRAVVVELTF